MKNDTKDVWHRNKKRFLDEGIVELLCEIMRQIHAGAHHEDVACTNVALKYALVCTWNLSFDSEGRDSITGRTGMLDTIRDICQTHPSSAVRQEASGALWTLGDRKFLAAIKSADATVDMDDDVDDDEAASGSAAAGCIMLSYERADSAVANDLSVALEVAGVALLPFPPCPFSSPPFSSRHPVAYRSTGEVWRLVNVGK